MDTEENSNITNSRSATTDGDNNGNIVTGDRNQIDSRGGQVENQGLGTTIIGDSAIVDDRDTIFNINNNSLMVFLAFLIAIIVIAIIVFPVLFGPSGSQATIEVIVPAETIENLKTPAATIEEHPNVSEAITPTRSPWPKRLPIHPERGNIILAHSLSSGSPIKIDGEIGDWLVLPDFAFYPIDKLVWENSSLSSPWGGLEDLGGLIGFSWDSSGLYLVAVVSDEKHAQNNRDPSKIYLGDGIELLFDSDLDGDINSFYPNQDDYRLLLSPGNFKLENGIEKTFALYQGGSYLNPNEFNIQGIVIGSRQLSLNNNDELPGYILEAFVPWDMFAHIGKMCEEFGATVHVYDDDNEFVNSKIDQVFAHSDSPNQASHHLRTNMWGQLVLGNQSGQECTNSFVQRPTRQPRTRCFYEADKRWESYDGEKLGCPLNEVQRPPASFQLFDEGESIWRGDNHLVYFFPNDKSYSTHWIESGVVPEDYFIEPLIKNGIGYLWFTNKGLQDRLGDPKEIEEIEENLEIQDFEFGTIFYLRGRIYILYPNGEWEKK